MTGTSVTATAAAQNKPLNSITTPGGLRPRQDVEATLDVGALVAFDRTIVLLCKSSSIRTHRRDRLMSGIASPLADPAVRSWHLVFCFAVMILPMVGLAIWYHRNINGTPGGRALMERQNRSRYGVRRGARGARENFREAGDLARDIERGAYGDDARRLQTIVYWVAGFWLLANLACFGVLIWADEINRKMPGN